MLILRHILITIDRFLLWYDAAKIQSQNGDNDDDDDDDELKMIQRHRCES